MQVEQFATPAVSVIIRKYFNGQEFILIQERHKEDSSKENGLLEIPGGKIREYENLFSALRREVREETGLVITRIQGEDETIETVVNNNKVITFTPFCITQNLSGAYSLIVNTFICEADGQPLDKTNESKNIRWVYIEDLKEMLNRSPEKFFLTDVTVLKKYFDTKAT